MTTNSTLAKALGAFWWLLTAVVVGAFGLMLLVMGIQVISRYALGVAVPWTDEVSRYLFLAEIFLGSVLALRYQEHIRITIVTDLLSARAKRVAAMLADIVSILVLGMIMAAPST